MKVGLFAPVHPDWFFDSPGALIDLQYKGGFHAMQETIYVGLDMGSSRCQQAVIGADGTVVFSRIVPTSEQHLRSAFADLGGEASVHLEAGELSAGSRSNSFRALLTNSIA